MGGQVHSRGEHGVHSGRSQISQYRGDSSWPPQQRESVTCGYQACYSRMLFFRDIVKLEILLLVDTRPAILVCYSFEEILLN